MKWLGSDEFRKERLEQTGKWLGPDHFGQERREAAEIRAHRIIEETLQRERWVKRLKRLERFDIASGDR